MQTLKTYIIEDSPVIRESLIETLQELGPIAVVGVADNEQGAVQWLTDDANDWHLVIVDLFLRAGSGLGVIRTLRGRKAAHSIVVLSNYASDDMRATCIELGADRVFDKSTEIEALLQYCTGLSQQDGDPGAPRTTSECRDPRY